MSETSEASSLTLKQVDVFTGRPFYGNPVAVVLGGEGLETEDMQRIACWVNLSETTFLLPSSQADYRLRIFTPQHELPFAGHPTIGSAYAALESGFVEKKKLLRQECTAGILDLSFEDERIFVRGPEPRITDVRRGLPFAKKLLRIEVGPIWIVGEVADAQELAALKPDMGALAAFTIDHEATGITVFAPSGEKQTAMHVRSFAPAHGIPEDPVCGSGNLAVAHYLKQTNSLKRFGERYIARQGMQMKRDGRVHVRVDEDGVRIGGRAVTCIEGTLRI
ncbi:MAG TPA: PhzF family phenazine biosynthesis protein [Burkholderiales bacterium]|jgi:predicted PhzF superfamily epimerase YddE/YHI9|nr:PhzF family phenazine biosynthesis protein [Burkholderiales bacterium]